MTAFKKATRHAVKLKLAVQGPSGSGKTLGALALAKALAGGGRIAVIDTENGSASLYAERFDFDVLELHPPYTSLAYLTAIEEAAKAEYPVVVIDSLSHQWAGEGGILSRKEDADKRGGNQFTNWQPFSKEHEGFKAGLLSAPIHIVATLRTKQEYALKSEGGKTKPKKLGMAPIQREGMEYEFTLVWELQMDHRAAASKDRTSLFTEGLVDLLDPKVPQRLLAWLASAPEQSNGKPAASSSVVAAGDQGSPAPAAGPLWPVGPKKGTPLKDMTVQDLTAGRAWADKKRLAANPEDAKAYARLLEDIDETLENKREPAVG